MTTAGVSNMFIQDIFNRIKEKTTIHDFFKAILSCPSHSQIRYIRDDLAHILPGVLTPIREEKSMPEWIADSIVALAGQVAFQVKFKTKLHVLLEKLSDNDWAKDWAFHTIKGHMRSELQSLVEKQAGLHSNASHTTMKAIQTFQIANLGDLFQQKAPMLWSLVEELGDAFDRRRGAQLEKKSSNIAKVKGALQLGGDNEDSSNDSDESEEYSSG
jgi:hypothetical protein